jgi:hypothetical protein
LAAFLCNLSTHRAALQFGRQQSALKMPAHI